MEEINSNKITENNLSHGNDDNLNTENKKYIDPECYNDDLEEVKYLF